MRLSDPVIGQDWKMSSATPAAFWSAISTTTTSASPLSAMHRAAVAPTFPAPPTTVTFRFIGSPEWTLLHTCNNRVRELRGAQLRRACHLAREIVGDLLGGDRPVHSADDHVGGLVPAKVPEHHFTRENHRSRVHLVL